MSDLQLAYRYERERGRGHYAAIDAIARRCGLSWHEVDRTLERAGKTPARRRAKAHADLAGASSRESS